MQYFLIVFFTITILITKTLYAEEEIWWCSDSGDLGYYLKINTAIPMKYSLKVGEVTEKNDTLLENYKFIADEGSYEYDKENKFLDRVDGDNTKYIFYIKEKSYYWESEEEIYNNVTCVLEK